MSNISPVPNSQFNRFCRNFWLVCYTLSQLTVRMICFKGRHYKKTTTLMAVRSYLAYPLSYRNIEELMAERGVRVDHSTVNRWVIKYSPKLEKKFCNSYKKAVGSSWRMDETYIKVKGKWCYLYRAVDKSSATIDFMLSKNRDKKSAKRFFNKAIGYSEKPEKITIDKSGSNNTALNLETAVERTSQHVQLRFLG